MSEVRNIPRLRFPEFEKIWDVNLFSDFYEFQTTNSYSRDNLNYEYGKLKNIHYGDIHTKFRTQFIVNNEDVPYINDDIDISKIKTNQILKEGDLVIADASEDYSDIGKSIEIIHVDGKKVVAGLHTLHAKSKNRTYVGFGGFMMKSPSVRKSLMMIAQGTKVLGISYKRVSQIKINTPTLPEQQKIADFLTAVDKRIELLEKKKTLLETYKKGVMKKIFNLEIRFKDDNGNDFPDWEEKRLGEICKLQGGYAFKSNSFKDTGIPIIRISNISNDNNYLNLENLVHYEEISNEENFTVLKGDLLIAMSGATTGKTSISNYDGKCYLNQRVGLFKSKTDKLNYSYLVQFVYSPMFGSQLVRFLVAGAQPNISSKDIESVRIPFPLTIEQQKISQFLSSIDTQLKLIETQIDKSKTWKKGLLQKMFV